MSHNLYNLRHHYCVWKHLKLSKSRLKHCWHEWRRTKWRLVTRKLRNITWATLAGKMEKWDKFLIRKQVRGRCFTHEVILPFGVAHKERGGEQLQVRMVGCKELVEHLCIALCLMLVYVNSKIFFIINNHKESRKLCIRLYSSLSRTVSETTNKFSTSSHVPS